MHAGQELRFLVAAIVDDRLLQAAKARSRIGGDVLDAGCLDDIDHKVRSRPADNFILGMGGFFPLAVSRRALRRRIRSCDLGAMTAAALTAAPFKKERRSIPCLLM